ncbi:MAG: YdcF family protein [Candidatus Andeanibacterium colombiense]|uniref:YdcF family protein n=1 Tax=Candidatus Andeanibacterium colombiense TaxID=3121345 RepID=A0AAJ6BPZ9_9SPHN|nr:MAG: YdcF family protein [Sphingomonadaceae bacterium]
MIWALGFFWFAVFLPGPAAGERTDAIVVLTGGPGRIDRGLQVLRGHKAGQLLVTGVYNDVTPDEFAAEYKVDRRLMECCVTLGFAALDTRGNAQETAEWVARRRIRSLRLVTTDWHMRRAAAELAGRLPAHVEILEDAVPSQPSLWILFLEYHKLLASRAVRLVTG